MIKNSAAVIGCAIKALIIEFYQGMNCQLGALYFFTESI